MDRGSLERRPAKARVVWCVARRPSRGSWAISLYRAKLTYGLWGCKRCVARVSGIISHGHRSRTQHSYRAVALFDRHRHKGSGGPLAPATPPDMPVRIGRFRGLRIASETPDLPPVPSMDLGFAMMCSLARRHRPQIQLVSIGARVC